MDHKVSVPVGDPNHSAAFFDIDQTLIKGASAYHIARALYKRGFFGKRDIAFATWHALIYRYFGEDPGRIRRVVNHFLKVAEGNSAEELRQLTSDLYDEIFASRIFPGTRAILDDHLKYGQEVWLVSATPHLVSQVFAERMGATGSIGTRVRVDGHGRFIPELEGDIMHQRRKSIAVIRLASTRNLVLANSYAYGDSANDLPMLSLVGHPCAINPEPLLRLVALERGWPIYNFRRRRVDVKKVIKRGAQTALGALVVSDILRRFTRWF